MTDKGASLIALAESIKVEKGVPLPSRHAHQRYPFDDMEVGDSIAVPLSGETRSVGNGKLADVAALNLRNAAFAHGKKKGVSFTVRTLRQDGVARCWRVA